MTMMNLNSLPREMILHILHSSPTKLLDSMLLLGQCNKYLHKILKDPISVLVQQREYARATKRALFMQALIAFGTGSYRITAKPIFARDSDSVKIRRWVSHLGSYDYGILSIAVFNEYLVVFKVSYSQYSANDMRIVVLPHARHKGSISIEHDSQWRSVGYCNGIATALDGLGFGRNMSTYLKFQPALLAICA